MRAGGRPDLRKVLLRSVVAIAARLGAWGLCWAVFAAFVPGPLEYREGAVVLSTRLLLQGLNPFAMAQQPVHLNVYGIGYQLLAWPVAAAFGASYATHRLLATALVAAAGASMWSVLRRDGVGPELAAAGALVVFFHFAQGMSVMARPDSLGWLLFWLTLAVPWRRDFSAGSLAAAALLGAAAFLTKPYFVLGLPLLAVWLVLCRDLARGLAFGAAAIAVLALTVFAVDATLPAYFTDTFFVHLNAETPNPEHLKATLTLFLMDNAGMLVALAVGGFAAWRAMRSPASGGPPRPGWRRGLLASVPGLRAIPALPLPAFVLACNAVLIVAKLGRHVGNGILYYDQLLVPFLVWTVWVAVERGGRPLLAVAALAVGLGANLLGAPPLPKRNVAAWSHLRELVSRPGTVYHPPPLAVWVADAGKEVWDNGQTEYCVLGKPGNFSRVAKEYRQRCRAHFRRVNESLAAGAFDLVVVTGMTGLVDPRTLASRYRPVARLPMPTLMNNVPADVWVRREAVTAPAPEAPGR